MSDFLSKGKGRLERGLVLLTQTQMILVKGYRFPWLGKTFYQLVKKNGGFRMGQFYGKEFFRFGSGYRRRQPSGLQLFVLRDPEVGIWRNHRGRISGRRPLRRIQSMDTVRR